MRLALIFHHHQPTGQLPWALEEVWRDCYRPFLETLERFPQVRAGLHYSGLLLEWLRDNRPETIVLIKRLLRRGQVELLGGAYAEAILPIWPVADQQEQLRVMQSLLQRVFGVRPQGFWLAERVWDPELAHLLTQAGYTYTALDGSLLLAAGQYPDGQVFACDHLKVLPISQELRLLIPWKEPADTLDFLRARALEGVTGGMLFADDGEKFGAWPGTHEWVYHRGWLEQFFQLLSTSANEVQCVLPGKWAASAVARQLTIPPGSYPEMMSWAGGEWHGFLERYGEAADLYHEVLDAGSQSPAPGVSRTDRDQTRRHLLRAQCNDAYWHGVFGGLYLPHLRQAVYHETAQARQLLEGPHSPPSTRERDDGALELRNPYQRLLFRPQSGQLFHWSVRPRGHNLLATLQAYRERYHQPQVPVDWYRRGACIDHFLGEATTPLQFAEARFPEQGDFASESWACETRQANRTLKLLAVRQGGVWVGQHWIPLQLRKQLTVEDNVLRVLFQFQHQHTEPLELWWGTEWNLVLSGSVLPERYYQPGVESAPHDLRHLAEFDRIQQCLVVDQWLEQQVRFEFETPLSLWQIPAVTHACLEGGQMEQIYQQSCFLFHRRLLLPPAETCEVRLAVHLERCGM